MTNNAAYPGRVRGGRVAVAGSMVLIAVLAGCSSGSATKATGAIATPKTGSTAAPSGTAAASPTPGSTAAGSTAAATGAAVPTLRPKPGAKASSCDAAALAGHLALASGAVHHYLAGTDKQGQAVVVALKSSSAQTTGGKAAAFAATQLTAGNATVKGCAVTAALTSVAGQTAAYLSTLSPTLRARRATSAQVASAQALIEDVNAQARRAGLAVRDSVPSVASLG